MKKSQLGLCLHGEPLGKLRGLGLIRPACLLCVMGNANNWVVAAGGATTALKMGKWAGGPNNRVPGKVGAAGEPKFLVGFSDAIFFRDLFFSLLQLPPTGA